MKALIVFLMVGIIGATLPQRVVAVAKVQQVEVGTQLTAEANPEQTFIDGVTKDVLYTGGPRVLGYGVGSRNF